MILGPKKALIIVVIDFFAEKFGIFSENFAQNLDSYLKFDAHTWCPNSITPAVMRRLDLHCGLFLRNFFVKFFLQIFFLLFLSLSSFFSNRCAFYDLVQIENFWSNIDLRRPHAHTHIKRKIPHFTTLLAKTKRTPWRGSAFLPGAFGKVRKREIADTYRMRQIEQQ